MQRSKVRVGNRLVGSFERPYVIAEIGSNHHGELQQALELIDRAADAGADAVKVQLFDADALYPRGSDMWHRFRAVEMPSRWLPELSARATARGVHIFGSVFDLRSLDHLREIRPPALKIASSEATNHNLLDRCARTGLPLFISTGMCDLVDVHEAIDVCVRAGNTSIVLLQCGSVYPLPPEDAHLRVMDLYADVFPYPVGLSDHTLGTAVAFGAVGRGASVIEKHITLDRNAGGPDDAYALEPPEFTVLVQGIKEVHVALGDRQKDLLEQERQVGRREGLYASRDLAAGSVLTDDDVVTKRPALGIRARQRSYVIGATLTETVQGGQALTWSMLRL